MLVCANKVMSMLRARIAKDQILQLSLLLGFVIFSASFALHSLYSNNISNLFVPLGSACRLN
jgi:hypothetical protein